MTAPAPFTPDEPRRGSGRRCATGEVRFHICSASKSRGDSMTGTLETDYLIIGAGAAAMAFADELLSNSDARIVMVDRRDKPGGHWNDAYPFVRLHQPAAFYGVNSRDLGSLNKDTAGFNKG